MAGFLDGSYKKQHGGRYLNRYDAGRAIASEFRKVIEGIPGKGVVAGLPRGGIEVAAAISVDLKLPLDFRAVRKVGHPAQPEFAIGAVDISGKYVRNPLLTDGEFPPPREFEAMVENELVRAREMEKELRGGKKSLIDDADWVLVVDDGAATGLTMLAVVHGLKSEGKKVYVGLPVASVQAVRMLEEVADDVFAVDVPEYFGAVGQFYDDFSQLSTADAKGYLEKYSGQ